MRAKNGTYIVDPPKVTWILVANRAEAVVFRRERGLPAEFVERWENPAGRKRDAETSEASRVIPGGGKAPYETARHEEPAVRFARWLGRSLATRRSQGRFDDLVLVAEPHFLGMLRASLPKAAQAVVALEIPRELRFADSQQVDRKLRDWSKAMALSA